ncbi:MAG: DUF167 family protein [Myxococcota bacterium]
MIEAPLPIDSGESDVSFWIRVKPQARRPGVGGVHGDALQVTVAAPAQKGRANAACVAALAAALQVPRSAVRLDPGARGRHKRVRVCGDPNALCERLHALAGYRRVG